jgi:hypothetical protein
MLLLVAVAAGAKSAPGGSGKSEAGLEATITTKVRQLTVLTRNITRWGCDRAPSASSVEKCRQLNIQARELTAEVEGLKKQAGSNWTSEKQAAAEPSAKKARPLPPRRYTYRQETDAGASYRTVCVRLCDGAYFPVSEVVSPQGFLADEQKCQSSCGVPAKLFYQTPFAEEKRAGWWR